MFPCYSSDVSYACDVFEVQALIEIAKVVNISVENSVLKLSPRVEH